MKWGEFKKVVDKKLSNMEDPDNVEISTIDIGCLEVEEDEIRITWCGIDIKN